MKKIELDTVLLDWKKKDIILEIIKDIKSGKEADVYLVKDNKEQRYALKIYKKHTDHSIGNNNLYLAGNWVKKPSLRRAIYSNNTTAKEYLSYNWTKREYTLLKRFSEEGGAVPRVFGHTNDSILMEYLGTEHESAPRIYEVELNEHSARFAFNLILHSMRLFIQHNVVHGDLSKFNILWWDNKPYIIDLPQAVDIKSNPNAQKLLERDIKHVIYFFKNYIDIDTKEIINELSIHGKTS